MKKHPMRFLSFILLLGLVSCEVGSGDVTPSQITGWAPVYADATVYDSISVEGVKPTIRAGKIYAYNSFIFQVDQFRGVHIVGNGQSANAAKVAFLKIPFCTEVAVKGNFLYANNLNDLLVFNISNPVSPVLVKRMKDAFPAIIAHHPEQSGYFECVDPSKGIVVDWQQKTIYNPKCRR
jgi:hypothetical protein